MTLAGGQRDDATTDERNDMGTTHRQQSQTTDGANYLDLAGEALLAGMTREQVIA
jgi:hypothetical protein